MISSWQVDDHKSVLAQDFGQTFARATRQRTQAIGRESEVL